MGERGGQLEEKEKKEKARKEIIISSSSEEEAKGNMLFPRMVLRVLLVEADDSTRQIIAALLRKCSYRVTAVSDGLKAWEKLKGRPHNVDLILTEVELPSISGYALLTLIMEHDICKNIPVIMMSSKDSVSVVLKCMFKGAADYLIKPIRKNELKNLWQHVWRRQINEARNVPERKNVTQEKVDIASQDNGANDHSSNNLTSARRSKHCCEKCSDSQSSCGTPYLEAETACKPNMRGKLQVKLENASSTSNTRKDEEYAKMAKKLANSKSDSGGLQEDCAKLVKDTKMQLDSLLIESNCRTCGAIDVHGNFDGCPAELDCHFPAEDCTKKVDLTSKLELSSRQMHPSHTKDERAEQHAFHFSKASAFSRYDNSKVQQPLFPRRASNAALLNEGTDSFHKKSSDQLPAFYNTARHSPSPTKGQGNMRTPILGQSGQPEAAFPGVRLGFFPIPGARFDGVYSSYDYMYPPTFYMQSSFPSFWSQRPLHEESAFPSSSSIHSTSEVTNSGQIFNLNKESALHSAEGAVPQNEEKFRMTKEVGNSSPVLHLSSYLTNKLNDNVTGSFCSTNGGTHFPDADVARPTESVNDNGLLVQDGLQGIGSQCNSQRQAALIKFRQKRKDRCYEKKVRYQTRKRLAEQRPRVKGQFVRHVPNESLPLDADDCP